MIDLLLLGTGAMQPLPDRYLSSVLVRVGSSLILIDCGEGTQVAMRQYHWGFKRLDTILLTHFHADHVAGLPGLMHTLAHSGKTEPLHIIGPPGTYQIVQGLFVIVGGLPFEVFIHEMEGGQSLELPSGLHLRTAWGEHRGPVLAYRCDLDRAPAFLPERARELGVPQHRWSELQRGESIELDGKVVTPSVVLSEPRVGIAFGMATDTRPTPEVRDLMDGVDLLISEATYGDDADAPRAAERGHMTFREAATLARDANAGTLWLTHFGVALSHPQAWIANATSVFARTEVGVSGMRGSIAYDRGYEPAGGVDSGNLFPESTDSI